MKIISTYFVCTKCENSNVKASHALSLCRCYVHNVYRRIVIITSAEAKRGYVLTIVRVFVYEVFLLKNLCTNFDRFFGGFGQID